MSTSPAKPTAKAAKAGTGTEGKVAQETNSTTAAKSETKASGADEAPKSVAKAPVSDTKSAETDAKTPVSDPIPTEVAENAKKLVDSAIDTAATASTAAPTEKMVNIKMLRSHPRLAYATGEKGSIPQSLFDELLGDGPFFEKV